MCSGDYLDLDGENSKGVKIWMEMYDYFMVFEGKFILYVTYSEALTLSLLCLSYLCTLCCSGGRRRQAHKDDLAPGQNKQVMNKSMQQSIEKHGELSVMAW